MTSFSMENNAESIVVDDPLLAAATTLNVSTGGGDVFPSTFPFLLTIWDETTYPDPTDDSTAEIVRCTNKTGNALTIVRGQEDTSDVEHTSGDRVALLLTAGLFNDSTYGITTHIDNLLSRNNFIDYTDSPMIVTGGAITTGR